MLVARHRPLVLLAGVRLDRLPDRHRALADQLLVAHVHCVVVLLVAVVLVAAALLVAAVVAAILLGRNLVLARLAGQYLVQLRLQHRLLPQQPLVHLQLVAAVRRLVALLRRLERGGALSVVHQPLGSRGLGLQL